MTGRKSQEDIVGAQFGSRAEAYLHSAVHAQGPDLKALVSIVQTRPGCRVLDLGCGGGHVTLNVAPHVREITAYDLSPEMLAVTAKAAADRGLRNVTTRQGTVEHLPFEDGRFDCVLSRYSAHHWRNLGAGLREARRVLKAGGVAAFVDTVTPEDVVLDTYFQTIELLRDRSHVRNYSSAEWKSALAGAGLMLATSSSYRIRLDFAVWVERMRPPAKLVDAIRELQTTVNAETTQYFETAGDGSFSIDVALFQTTAAAQRA
jgi:SAM-dependent methyltransferase